MPSFDINIRVLVLCVVSAVIGTGVVIVPAILIAALAMDVASNYKSHKRNANADALVTLTSDSTPRIMLDHLMSLRVGCNRIIHMKHRHPARTRGSLLKSRKRSRSWRRTCGCRWRVRNRTHNNRSRDGKLPSRKSNTNSGDNHCQGHGH